MYGGVPLTMFIPIDPLLRLHDELFVVIDTILNDDGVNSVTVDIAVHKPASVTDIVIYPAPKLVKVYVESNDTSTNPVEAE
jgi:hypothetical protein